MENNISKITLTVYLFLLVAVISTASSIFYLANIRDHEDRSNVELASEEIVPEETTQASLDINSQAYQVTKVVDGDTIKVLINGEEETIRVIGIDTPELKGDECYAQKAKDKVQELLSNSQVTLETDPTQGQRDRYERLLRYVFLEDGRNLSEVLISEGYGYEYTYNKDYKYKDDFVKAEEDAKFANLGLWSACE